LILWAPASACDTLVAPGSAGKLADADVTEI
jgi:hypothetical protein